MLVDTVDLVVQNPLKYIKLAQNSWHNGELEAVLVPEKFAFFAWLVT